VVWIGGGGYLEIGDLGKRFVDVVHSQGAIVLYAVLILEICHNSYINLINGYSVHIISILLGI
jgi:hypothetical protein